MRTNALNSLLESALSNNGSNMTSDTLAGLSPTSILETFVPGYGLVHKFLLFSFGFDITSVVFVFAAVFLFNRSFRSVWSVIWGLISNNYMSEITVSSSDEIHGHLISFLAHHYKTSSSRRLMAETPSTSAWELDSEDTETQESAILDSEGNIQWLNFSNQEAKTLPRFTPAQGSHNFWHKGTYFQLRRREQTVFDELSGGAASFKDKEQLTLSCFGRSTDPIKGLIQHAKLHYHQGHNAKTVIKRPAPKDMRRFVARGGWMKIAERPCRPMKTVVLDEERKFDVLADINEYLSPATARWYAARGVPYRRGYLFHGPPGTGKTSLTFALAGVFGLDIHVVSLLEPTLTEEELGMLFTTLPARCIVLLEDIDTAGLIRNEPQIEETTNTQSGNGDFNMGKLTKALKKANQQSDEERKKGISLSGLLNIIDGVASHEGRVLIMTTNHPEKLDEALIRPGRIDHQVAFSNATQYQIGELFERMYANDLPRTTKVLKDLSNSALSSSKPNQSLSIPTTGSTTEAAGVMTPPKTPTNSTPSENVTPPRTAFGKNDAVHLSAAELTTIAAKFAAHIPDHEFSPAEIQGFLLKRKTEPLKALQEVEGWVQGILEQRRKGTKLIEIQ